MIGTWATENSQNVNPDLGGRDYETFKAEFAEQILETFARYCPNMTRRNVLGQYIYTGREYALQFPNMRNGDIFMGPYELSGRNSTGVQPKNFTNLMGPIFEYSLRELKMMFRISISDFSLNMENGQTSKMLIALGDPPKDGKRSVHAAREAEMASHGQ